MMRNEIKKTWSLKRSFLGAQSGFKHFDIIKKGDFYEISY